MTAPERRRDDFGGRDSRRWTPNQTANVLQVLLDHVDDFKDHGYRNPVKRAITLLRRMSRNG